jgi:hypothetical protein
MQGTPAQLLHTATARPCTREIVSDDRGLAEEEDEEADGSEGEGDSSQGVHDNHSHLATTL